MSDNIENAGDVNDPGYYTPKNILNPAMFRLAEITRALSEVNMEIDQEKLFEDSSNEQAIQNAPKYEKLQTEDIEKNFTKETISTPKPLDNFTQKLKRNEDDIGKILIFTLAISIGLFLVLLCLSWPE